jgi:hypothetical protein
MSDPMSFHPDQSLPDCMIPDGGGCCAGHAAVCDDWHKQRREIERLRAQVARLDRALRTMANHSMAKAGL